MLKQWEKGGEWNLLIRQWEIWVLCSLCRETVRISPAHPPQKASCGHWCVPGGGLCSCTQLSDVPFLPDTLQQSRGCVPKPSSVENVTQISSALAYNTLSSPFCSRSCHLLVSLQRPTFCWHLSSTAVCFALPLWFYKLLIPLVSCSRGLGEAIVSGVCSPTMFAPEGLSLLII